MSDDRKGLPWWRELGDRIIIIGGSAFCLWILVLVIRSMWRELS